MVRGPGPGSRLRTMRHTRTMHHIHTIRPTLIRSRPKSHTLVITSRRLWAGGPGRFRGRLGRPGLAGML